MYSTEEDSQTQFESLDQSLGISPQMQITCRTCDHSVLYTAQMIVDYLLARCGFRYANRLQAPTIA
jgi:hypothetical protein